MVLTAGSRLGAYEIVAPLGAGGMGEVYRARDPKLNREVAIKVLLAAVANDPERLLRFSREAHVLASLNHPNIAHIYGLEDSDGVRALVMELVEGPTLADRIAQGAIPLDDALPIARQIAEALEAAHGQGIIHRDLKPANIKVKADGTVKVLDFGLAKALDPPGASSANATNSPTFSIHATHAGVILGTAAYMAPEQARGKVVDKRADIWAFGCVIYEMLTGRRTFAGAELSDTLAFVLTKAPDWTALPAITPTPIRRLLRRCLEKDRMQRLADIADARLEIDEALTTPASDSTTVASVVTPVRPAFWRRALPWAIAAILGIGWVLGRWAPWNTTPPPAPQRLSVQLGVDGTLPTTDAPLVLSPDGMLLAFVARTSGSAPQLTFDARTMVWVDRTGAIAALRAVATDWSNPEFSPDGRRIAMDIRGEGHRDIWVYDWTRETMTRVTSEGTNEAHPVWTPDGVRIVYRSFRSATDPSGNTLSWKRADGSGDTQVLLQSQATLIPGSWHPTNKVLAYVATMPGTGNDVMMLPVEGDEAGGWKPGQPTGFMNTSARERAPTFSPNGKWLSYSSNESGGDQVYVQRFPGPSERVMVSSAGGHTSSWSRTRPELVFAASALDYRHVLMVAPYRVENESFRADKPRLWAERAPALRETVVDRLYALHPDGVRVVIAPPAEGEAVGQNHVTFVLDFFDELRRIAPGQEKKR